MKPLIYMSCPMSGLTADEASAWIAAAREIIDPRASLLSPIRKERCENPSHAFGNFPSSSMFGSDRAITASDRFDVMRSDMVICNLLHAKKVSIGAMIELGWADMGRKPIITILPRRGLEINGLPVHDHPMVRDISSWVVHSIEEAAQIVNTVLFPSREHA